MARNDQSDLFATESDLFDEDAPTPVYRADPDEVRAELYKILAEARAAKTLPWEPKQVSLYKTIFPQMTNWLPEGRPRSSVSISNRNWAGSMPLEVRRAGKGASAPCPPFLDRMSSRRMVGMPPNAFAPGRFAHPTHSSRLIA
jgi:hypothetical protein